VYNITKATKYYTITDMPTCQKRGINPRPQSSRRGERGGLGERHKLPGGPGWSDYVLSLKESILWQEMCYFDDCATAGFHESSMGWWEYAQKAGILPSILP